jgi:RNA polymerase sigma-70 factor, ECF subfamily
MDNPAPLPSDSPAHMSTPGGDLDVTGLLVAWERGDDEALRRVAPLVYDDLRAIAAAKLRNERREHTLQPTALVHEAYLRLSEQRRRQWKERRQFFAVASRLMRQVLVDHARARSAAKRGGEATLIAVTSLGEIAAPPEVFDVLSLDEALTRLATLQPRLARVVELRFFGGLEVEETAALLDCSPRTVKRDWALARAWLVRELSV